MLPLIPFEVLIPLTIGATGLCLGLIVAIIGRRLMIRWWSEDKRLTQQAGVLLAAVYQSGGRGEVLTKWIGRNRPGRIESLVRAVESAQVGNGDFRGWVAEESPVPPKLSSLVLAAPKRKLNILGVSRWTRVAAAKALGRLNVISSFSALVKAMDDPDHEVAYAAADSLARLNAPEAADAILERITANPRLNNARLAALVEGMTCDLTDVFRKHLERADAQALFWSATLIGQKQIFDLVQSIRPLLESPEPNVRAAACEAVGQLKIPLTDRWLAPLVHDDKWFVQSHAAKSLGELNAVWAVEDLIELLQSKEWWVRQNAADALVMLGERAVDHVERLLNSPDRFARNSAVEVLERLGWIQIVLARIVRGDVTGEGLLLQFGKNGGIGYLENAMFQCPEPAVPVLLRVLLDLGDDATYGRLRAAAEQMPEYLRPMVHDVAAAVRGR